MAENKVTETNKSLLKETRQNAKSRESLKFFNRPHTAATGAAVSDDDAPKTETEKNLDRRADDAEGA